MKLNEPQRLKIHAALDALAFALTEKNHVWMRSERDLYEKAVAILKRK